MKKSKYQRKYKKYLQSDEWAEIRNDVVLINNGVCQSCYRKTKYPQVHHLTYKNIFHEEPEDLTLLCKKCHEKIHNSGIKFNKKNFNKLLAENKSLRSVIEDAIKIKPIWMPNDNWKDEHKNEAMALSSMLKALESALR